MKNIVPRRRIVPGWPAFSTWVILVLWLFPCGLASAQFLYTTNSGTITITGYDGPGGWVIVPDTIGGLPVSSIADAAFQNQTNINVLELPQGITSIGTS